MNRLSTATLTMLTLLVPTLLPVRVLAQAPENVGTGAAAIEPSNTIQDCSSGGNTCSTTYPQIYDAFRQGFSTPQPGSNDS